MSDWLIPDWVALVAIGLWILPFWARPLLDRLFERRSKLLVSLVNSSAVSLPPQPRPTGQEGPQPQIPYAVYGHTVLIKNVGQKPATNVRIGHNASDFRFNLFPIVPFKKIDLDGGGFELALGSLAPNEQLLIHYLYFPPVLFNQVGSYWKSDDGDAVQVSVAPVVPESSWMRAGKKLTSAAGVLFITYLVLMVASWVVTLYNQRLQQHKPAAASTQPK